MILGSFHDHGARGVTELELFDAEIHGLLGSFAHEHETADRRLEPSLNLPRILAELFLRGHETLKRHGKEIAEKAEGMQSFLLREHKPAGVRSTLQRGAHAAAARAAEIYIAAQESRDGKRPGNNYGFVVEAFFAEKSLAVGDINRKIVEVRLGNGGSDFLGVCQTRDRRD